MTAKSVLEIVWLFMLLFAADLVFAHHGGSHHETEYLTPLLLISAAVLATGIVIAQLRSLLRHMPSKRNN